MSVDEQPEPCNECNPSKYNTPLNDSSRPSARFLRLTNGRLIVQYSEQQKNYDPEKNICHLLFMPFFLR